MKRQSTANQWTLVLGTCALLLWSIDGVAAAANSADDVCRRWVCDRADMSEGVSTGDVTTCTTGDLLAPGRPNALKLVNLYRFLTGMPAVTEDPTFDTDAQACAIIQAANGLSHTPAATDPCYNATGAAASNRSSICGGQAVGCIDLYMDDSANATGPNFGHRTWILANSLGPVGFGSVGTGRAMTASCFYQVGGTGKAGVAYVGWPPAGPVPLQAFTATELDKSGWSLQSDTIDLDNATATVMDGTTSEPVTVSTKLGSYGAQYAMGITPNGWSSLAGHSYTVTIGGTSTPISYTVQVVDCSSTTTSSCTSSATGAGGAISTGTGGASTAGTGGASTTGTGGSSSSTGAGGNPSTGTGGAGTAGAGGAVTTGTGASAMTSPTSGCSCATIEASHGPLAFVVLLLLALVLRRRKIL
ncbi:MAG TPA: MYXO-CTERM sorting domain-containing protein [Polyangia bacterium]|nr:MYXO-CTERM sorting domain-containing protein [Polyangia bacterium]